MRNKYKLEFYIKEELYFNKEYPTYKSIVDDFPIFLNAENVRTCKKMNEKSIVPKNYKKSEKYKYFKILKLN